MIYEFTIEEKSKTVIPVCANNADEAQKIFNNWYNKHNEDPTDSTIQDLLDNGYDGRTFTRSAAIEEFGYPKHAIMLPEESPTPIEIKYDFYIRFADGSNPIKLSERTLQQIGMELSAWGDKYYLYPDPENGNVIHDLIWDKDNKSMPPSVRVYAVLKDKEETWFEME